IALILNAAPTDRISAFGYRFVHRDKPTEPRMPRVPDFPRISIVGVALSSCITRGGGIRPSTTSVPPNSSDASGPVVGRSNARDLLNRGDRLDRKTAQDAPGAIFSREPLLRYLGLSTTGNRHDGDHAIENFRKLEDDV